VEVPDAEYIEQIGRALEGLLDRLTRHDRPDVCHAAQRALGLQMEFLVVEAA